MQQPPSQHDPESWWQPGLILFSRLSGWIVGPIILALILGKWLDKKFQTEPWGLLATVGISFVVSMIGIVKEGMAAMKQAEKESTKTDNANNQPDRMKPDSKK